MMSNSEDPDEEKHFRQIVRSFRNYKDHATRRVAYALKQFRELPERHRAYLEEDFEDNCKRLLECIDANYQVIELILEHVDEMFENASRDSKESEEQVAEKNVDMDSVYTTLRQIVRDWSADGQSERTACYKPILDELRSLYLTNGNESRKPGDIGVLVPGAGLGRLAFEIAIMGFRCQGNEFSLHMLMTSNFILNECDQSNQLTIHPYVRNWCNNLKFEDQAAAIKFPDLAPPEVTTSALQFSMCAGDFLEVYTEKEQWDCVATSFFIDTAHNIIEFIERIALLLKPGGHWINIGPLMYFNNSTVENSIELNYEQIRRIVERLGLVYLKEETNISCKYNENKRSMLQYSYNCVLFVVQKPAAK